jgi:hypothetical protein
LDPVTDCIQGKNRERQTLFPHLILEPVPPGARKMTSMLKAHRRKWYPLLEVNKNVAGECGLMRVRN